MHNRHPEYKITNKVKSMAESVEGFKFSLQETLKDLSINGKQINLRIVPALKQFLNSSEMLLAKETFNSSLNCESFKTRLEAVFHSFKARQQISFLIVSSEGKCTFTLLSLKLTTLT